MVKVWAYAGGLGKHKPPSKGEKAAITAACEKLIADVLKPLYLQKIVPTEYNYPVDIFGKWLGNKYRFIVRFRSDNPASTVSVSVRDQAESFEPVTAGGLTGSNRF
jgi:hypothetical protein